MSNIGILGGTFDPFHIGHLSIVDAVLSQEDFEKLIIMPAKVSPFKLGREMASEEDRLAMVRLVAEDRKNVEVSTVEIDRDEVSYTYETLNRLKDVYPEDELWFILGSDSLIDIDTWHLGKELLREFSFVLASRPGYDMLETDLKMRQYMERYGTRFRVLHNELINISSTDIKRRVKEGESLEDFVPGKIAKYIHEHGLYL